MGLIHLSSKEDHLIDFFHFIDDKILFKLDFNKSSTLSDFKFLKIKKYSTSLIFLLEVVFLF